MEAGGGRSIAVGFVELEACESGGGAAGMMSAEAQSVSLSNCGRIVSFFLEPSDTPPSGSSALQLGYSQMQAAKTLEPGKARPRAYSSSVASWSVGLLYDRGRCEGRVAKNRKRRRRRGKRRLRRR